MHSAMAFYEHGQMERSIQAAGTMRELAERTRDPILRLFWAIWQPIMSFIAGSLEEALTGWQAAQRSAEEAGVGTIPGIAQRFTLWPLVYLGRSHEFLESFRSYEDPGAEKADRLALALACAFA